MIYTAIDTFYVTDEQIANSPSRKDGIDQETEMTLRLYGCELIQESGILLRLPQAVMATGQVLFHRFYFKKSLARFNVKRVAASCVWLAAKLEESPRRIQQILNVFHRMECRRENLSLEILEPHSKKNSELKMDLNRTERHLLKEMGFICHVEHPHKFILNYLAQVEAPAELRQEAWNLANDSLRTTLCVRFKSEVVACGVVYAAARRFHVPLPENPPWWKVFDAEKHEIDEVCRVLANLYRQPKARYIAVCKDSDSFVLTNKTWDPPRDAKETLLKNSSNGLKVSNQAAPPNPESSVGRDVIVKAALDKLKEAKKSDDETRDVSANGDLREDSAAAKSKQGSHRADVAGDRSKDRDKERSRPRDRERDREKDRERDRDRGREWERDRERDKELEREREKAKDRSHRSKDRTKDTGHLEKSRHHSSSRDRDYQSSSYTTSREKERHRHHPYA
uniref:Cyclin-L1-1 n=1 Tax=Araucaria cunninghamii TaxID=56994 RepID=A0A0D6QWI6_ARACU